MALSELGKRAQKAIRKKGTQPGVSFYGQAYMNTLIKKYERVVAGISTMKPENIPKLYRDVVNATLKHLKGKAYSAVNQELRNIYKYNQGKVFETRAGKTRIKSNVKLPISVLSQLASKATTDPNIYIQNMVSERVGIQNKLREEYGLNIEFTDKEYERLTKLAEELKDDSKGEYSGWYAVYTGLGESANQAWNPNNLLDNIMQGDVFSLMIYDKLRGHINNVEQWKKLRDDVIARHDAIVEAGGHPSLLEYIDMQIANPMFTGEAFSLTSELMDAYDKAFPNKTFNDFMEEMNKLGIDFKEIFGY